MLTDEERKSLEQMAKNVTITDELADFQRCHAYVLEEASEERVLLRHARRVTCEITVKNGFIYVDMFHVGVIRFRWWGRCAIGAVKFLSGDSFGYIAEKCRMGQRNFETSYWHYEQAAHDLLEHITEEEADHADDEDWQGEDWRQVVEALEWDGSDYPENPHSFWLKLGEVDWELPSCGFGNRPAIEFVHALHAARSANAQLQKFI